MLNPHVERNIFVIQNGFDIIFDALSEDYEAFNASRHA